jgi:hypothetical protein
MSHTKQDDKDKNKDYDFVDIYIWDKKSKNIRPIFVVFCVFVLATFSLIAVVIVRIVLNKRCDVTEITAQSADQCGLQRIFETPREYESSIFPASDNNGHLVFKDPDSDFFYYKHPWLEPLVRMRPDPYALESDSSM